MPYTVLLWYTSLTFSWINRFCIYVSCLLNPTTALLSYRRPCKRGLHSPVSHEAFGHPLISEDAVQVLVNTGCNLQVPARSLYSKRHCHRRYAHVHGDCLCVQTSVDLVCLRYPRTEDCWVATCRTQGGRCLHIVCHRGCNR